MLNKDYRDILQLLNEENAEFLIIGAYALAAHGFPRATMDIDIWVKPSSENAKAVIKALQRFGVPLENLTAGDLQTDDLIFQIGVAPQRVDIITGVSGLIFEETVKNAKQILIDGIEVYLPSIEDIIKNKESTGRPKDLLDAEMLKTSLKTKRGDIF
jgi:predicted nucleotidyltransferase